MPPTHRITARTKARSRAVAVLFEADQRGIGDDPPRLVALLEERTRVSTAQTPLPSYSQEIVRGVAQHLAEVDERLAAHARGRLPAVDRAILRMGTWEILYNAREVPQVAAIDQAVLLAREMSTASSPGFVNAVLDTIRKESSAQGL